MMMDLVAADGKKAADVQEVFDRKHKQWIKNVVEGQGSMDHRC